MPNYERLYYKLFAAVSDVVEDLRPRDFFTLREELIRLLQEAEDRWLDETEPMPENMAQ